MSPRFSDRVMLADRETNARTVRPMLAQSNGADVQESAMRRPIVCGW